jgi:hypothetical protein
MEDVSQSIIDKINNSKSEILVQMRKKVFIKGDHCLYKEYAFGQLRPSQGFF